LLLLLQQLLLLRLLLGLLLMTWIQLLLLLLLLLHVVFCPSLVEGGGLAQYLEGEGHDGKGGHLLLLHINIPRPCERGEQHVGDPHQDGLLGRGGREAGVLDTVGRAPELAWDLRWVDVHVEFGAP
jgi:hypothetical protein